MENLPFEDVFPIENGDFPLPRKFSSCYMQRYVVYMILSPAKTPVRSGTQRSNMVPSLKSRDCVPTVTRFTQAPKYVYIYTYLENWSKSHQSFDQFYQQKSWVIYFEIHKHIFAAITKTTFQKGLLANSFGHIHLLRCIRILTLAICLKEMYIYIYIRVFVSGLCMCFCQFVYVIFPEKDKLSKKSPHPPRNICGQMFILNMPKKMSQVIWFLERKHMGVSRNNGTVYFHHPFWGTPIFGNTHMEIKFPYSYTYDPIMSNSSHHS